MSTSSLNLSSVLSTINDAFSGKTNGIDVQSTVNELMQVYEQPEVQMQQQQTDISQQGSLLSGISSDLQALQTATNSLRDITSGLNDKTATSSQSGIVTATADTTAAVGNHTVTVTNLAMVSSSYSDPVPSMTQLGGAEIDVAYGNPTVPRARTISSFPQPTTRYSRPPLTLTPQSMESRRMSPPTPRDRGWRWLAKLPGPLAT